MGIDRYPGSPGPVQRPGAAKDLEGAELLLLDDLHAARTIGHQPVRTEATTRRTQCRRQFPPRLRLPRRGLYRMAPHLTTTRRDLQVRSIKHRSKAELGQRDEPLLDTNSSLGERSQIL